MPEIHGTCDERFGRVTDAFERNFTELEDLGASFAMTVEGEFVVDIWAGHRDVAATEPWVEDTIVNVYSSTKTMTALCALLLADRGQLDMHAPVAQYWPEFAQNGKEGVEVRHLLSHSAGLSGLEVEASSHVWYDWDKVAELLAAQAPWWEPGTASGYHAITQGNLVGEVVRRISGRSLGTFLREELAEPLDADFHVGVDPKHFPRIAELVPPPVTPGEMLDLEPGSIAARTVGANAMVDVADTKTAAWRQAEMPAANGHGNARSIVRLQTLLANHGTAFGKTLMSPAGCMAVLEEQTSGVDLVLGIPMRFGLGYGLPVEGMPAVPNENVCFWGGYGGSLVVCDLDARVAFSYVMNRMDAGILGDERGFGLWNAAYESLEA